MAFNYTLAAAILKLLLAVILIFDTWRLFRPLPKTVVVWQARTSPAAELARHGLNTALFPLGVVTVLVFDTAKGEVWWTLALDAVLLLLVVAYLALPRPIAVLANGDLWLDGARLSCERLAGVEADPNQAERLTLMISWHGLLVRKRVVLNSAEEVKAAQKALVTAARELKARP